MEWGGGFGVLLFEILANIGSVRNKVGGSFMSKIEDDRMQNKLKISKFLKEEK